eukprot:scaffold21411_cov71-Phaeocystis_antarctica.AAC.1
MTPHREEHATARRVVVAYASPVDQVGLDHQPIGVDTPRHRRQTNDPVVQVAHAHQLEPAAILHLSERHVSLPEAIEIRKERAQRSLEEEHRLVSRRREIALVPRRLRQVRDAVAHRALERVVGRLVLVEHLLPALAIEVRGRRQREVLQLQPTTRASAQHVPRLHQLAGPRLDAVVPQRQRLGHQAPELIALDAAHKRSQRRAERLHPVHDQAVGVRAEHVAPVLGRGRHGGGRRRRWPPRTWRRRDRPDISRPWHRRQPREVAPRGLPHRARRELAPAYRLD